MDAVAIRPNLFTLRFPRRLEREYQRYHSERNVNYARAAFASGIILYAPFAPLDRVLSPDNYQLLWLLRIGIATPLFLLLLLFMFTRWFVLLMQPTIAFVCLLVALSVDIVNVVAFEDIGHAYFFGVIIINMYLHTFGRAQWAWAAPVGILNVVLYLLSLLLVEAASRELVWTAAYFMVSAMLLGMVACYTMEHMMRREFLHFRKLSTANAELHQHSRTDPLTGLLNRRSMLERMAEEAERSARVKRSFVIAIVDADHFKQVNDAHGHACGDEVLKRLACLMGDSLRVTDIVARWGGEEFLVLFPDTRLAGARIAAEQLRRRTRAMAIQHGEHMLRVTVTIGLAEVSPGEDLESALQRADEALYEGKRLGRDRTVSAVPLHASYG